MCLWKHKYLLKRKKEILGDSATLASLSISSSLRALAPSLPLMHVRNFLLFFTELAPSL